jgi:serine/threonine protein kinase
VSDLTNCHPRILLTCNTLCVQKGSNATSTRKELYALKIFLDRSTRPHFARECRVLEGLGLAPHPNIVHLLFHWKLDGYQYILFPLAEGDLDTFLRTTAQPQPTTRFITWYTTQLRGLSGALQYIHNFSLPTSEGMAVKHRIGFHHDLKPVNILLFKSGGDPAIYEWKISDFGSGFVSDFSDDDQESVYNTKPSTGDPIYTGPEFALEGRVSRPKDVWSLGCIFLETMIWVAEPSGLAIDEFRKTRWELPDDRRATKPMFWYQDGNGQIHIHPVVASKLETLACLLGSLESLEAILHLVSGMLTLSHHSRPTASEICKGFDQIFADIT